jgi:putative NADH-flavin reductase
MNIAILGATGRTGRPLVLQALEAGHEVTAFVRDRSKLGLEHPKLRVVRGEIGDAAALESAIAGSAAVLSALGPVRGGPKEIMTVAARSIVAAMQKTGVRRLVTLTGAGVDQPGDEPKAFNKFMSVMLNLFAKDILTDSREHARIVRASGLDWTIVRVPVLTDAPAKGVYRVGMVGIDDGARIPRADVATFMLRALEDRTQVGAAPVLSS